MAVRKKYIQTLREIEKTTPINFYDNFQLLNLIKNSRIKDTFNQCVSYDLFKPSNKKPYSILNTDNKHSPGVHWVGVYQDKNNIYVYDSFGRTVDYLMKPFKDRMKKLNMNVLFVNQKADQAGYQLNCGMRCLIWLLFVDRYGLNKCLNI